MNLRISLLLSKKKNYFYKMKYIMELWKTFFWVWNLNHIEGLTLCVVANEEELIAIGYQKIWRKYSFNLLYLFINCTIFFISLIPIVKVHLFRGSLTLMSLYSLYIYFPAWNYASVIYCHLLKVHIYLWSIISFFSICKFEIYFIYL